MIPSSLHQQRARAEAWRCWLPRSLCPSPLHHILSTLRTNFLINKQDLGFHVGAMTEESLGLSPRYLHPGLPAPRRLEGPRGERKESPAKSTFSLVEILPGGPPLLLAFPAASLTLATRDSGLLTMEAPRPSSSRVVEGVAPQARGGVKSWNREVFGNFRPRPP